MADPSDLTVRGVLLDVLEALADHRESLTLLAESSAGIELIVDPRGLAPEPSIAYALLREAAAAPTSTPGRFIGDEDVEVRLVVPQSLAHLLGLHGNVARPVSGLETALDDRERRIISALDRHDPRRIEIAVARSANLIAEGPDE